MIEMAESLYINCGACIRAWPSGLITKRDVEGEIIARTFSPTYWGDLWSSNWVRSELAADLYDEILFIDVSFAALQDKAEFNYLNNLPTSFVLPDEAVDRLRTAAGKIIIASPEFQKLLKDVGAKIVPEPLPENIQNSPVKGVTSADSLPE